MENVSYAARFRYLDADDVDDAVVDYDGLNVYGPDGHKIGDVDGFIVDVEARRVNYVVIDSGGWFASRQLLLPIGHTTLAADRKSLRADVSRDTLRRLPEYDPDRFRAISDEELRAFERNTVLACCPDESLEDVSVDKWGYDRRRHYTQPDWWRHSQYAPERLQPLGVAGVRPGASRPSASEAPARETFERERATARERTDAGTRASGEVSPHFDQRAQPGDVLGIETGGERTGIGDTSDDENRRRQAAEQAAADDEPRQSER
jgi:hypothetical protein